MRKMNSAPKDGTRILILRHTFGYSVRTGEHKKTGLQIIECWWTRAYSSGEPRWCVWCGNTGTHSTDHVDPVGWWPRGT